MTKIKFKVNADTLEPLIEQYIDKGDEYRALALLRRLPKDVNTLLNIAEIFADLDFIAQSNDALYEVLMLDKDNEDAKLLLAQNSFARGDVASAIYYASDEAFEMMKDMYQDEMPIEAPIESKYRIVYARDECYLSSAKEQSKIDAAEEFAHGNFDKAYELYLDLLAAEPNNIDLLNDIGFVCIMLNKPEQARKYIEASLKIDDKSAATLSNAVLLYDMLELGDKRAKYAEMLDKTDTDDLVKIFKTAAAFCESGEHERAKKWLKKYVDERDNLEIMLLYSIACYNSKDYGAAKEVLLKLLTVDPNNATVLYYLDHVTQKKDKKFEELEYSPQLPTSIIEKKIENLQRQNDFYSMWTDDDLFGEIDWALKNVNGNAFVTEIVDKIADTDTEKAKNYLLGLLLSQRFNNKAKKYIFKKALELGAKGKICIVADFKYFEIRIGEMPRIIADAMREALATLAFERVLTDGEIRKLYSVALDLQGRLVDNNMVELTSAEALPAVIVRNANLEGMTDIAICLAFDVELSALKELNQKIYG